MYTSQIIRIGKKRMVLYFETFTFLFKAITNNTNVINPYSTLLFNYNISNTPYLNANYTPHKSSFMTANRNINNELARLISLVSNNKDKIEW